jgi:hypothetical protein
VIRLLNVDSERCGRSRFWRADRPAYDTVAIADQILQDVEHLRLDGNDVVAAPQFPTLGIERMIVEYIDHPPLTIRLPDPPMAAQGNLSEKSRLPQRLAPVPKP